MNQTNRVLVVEDDYAFRWALASGLQRNDVDTDIAENGAEALELIRQHAYELVVLDLRLPKASGEEVISQLDALGRKSRVFIVSAYAETPEGLPPGARDIVRKMYRKPVDVNLIIEDVVSHLAAA